MNPPTSSSIKGKDGLNPISQQQRKPQQVKIQLPLVESSTQTDGCFFPPVYPQDGYSVPPPSYDAFPSQPINGGINQVPITPSSPLFPYPSHPTDIMKKRTEQQQQPLAIPTEAEESRESGSGFNKNSTTVSHNSSETSIFSKNLIKEKSLLSSYVIALRPWSFTVSISPVALGACLAYKSQGVFDVYVFLVTIFTALCVHAAGNLVNTYFDFVRGIDNKKSDDRTLVDSLLSPNDVVSLGALFYIAGCAGFALLTFISPAKMEHLALIYFCGLSSSFFYTGGLGLKYIAMGDIIIVMTFGPIAVVFSHLSQTGQLSLVPLFYTIPMALNTEAILHCNNARDMDSDRQAGAVTVAILLGKGGSYGLFCFLLFVPYILFITVGIHYSPYILLPALSIFFAFKLEKAFRRGDLTRLPHSVAKLNLLMGILYIEALYLADASSLPTMIPLGS